MAQTDHQKISWRRADRRAFASSVSAAMTAVQMFSFALSGLLGGTAPEETSKLAPFYDFLDMDDIRLFHGPVGLLEPPQLIYDGTRETGRCCSACRR